jgi:hypothetical protein
MKEMCRDVPDLNRNQLPPRFKLCVYGTVCDLCGPVDVKKKNNNNKMVDKFVIAVHCSLSDWTLDFCRTLVLKNLVVGITLFKISAHFSASVF